MSAVSRHEARPPAVRRFNAVMRFAWMRLRGIPREAARGCLEVDSETFMLDDMTTVPMALVPYVEAGRRHNRRHRTRYRFAFGVAVAVALACATLAWLL